MRTHNLLYLAGGIVLAVMIISCQTEQDIPEVDISTVLCSIPQINVEEDFATGRLDTLSSTRGSFSGNNFLWSEGDRIGIVPNSGAQIYFAVDNGAGSSTASFEGGDWAMKSTGTFYAYYPLYPDIFLSKDHVPVSYTGQVQSGNDNSLHTGDYWTLYTEGTTAIGNTLNFSFKHLTSFFKTYVTVPAGTYTKITFSAPSEVFIKDGYFDLSAQTPTIVGTRFTDELCLDLQNITFTKDTELIGLLVVAPVNITGIPITVTVFKDEDAAYEYSITKTKPMSPGTAYAFRATDLTQVATSAAQANALFASGATAVTITEPLTEDATVVLPNTEDAVSLSLPTTASTSKLTVSYPQDATSNPATLSITGPEGADLDIQTPNTTVTINGISYDYITCRTAANTCIISEGVTVSVLKVLQGSVQVYGTVSQIDLSEQEDDCIINVSGTVDSLLGEDDEEYVPATGISLNQTSINLNIGATESLTATVAPVGAYPDVVWTSSDETIATVSSSGVITAIAAGTASITAQTISGGYTATCVVSVISVPDYVDLGLPSGIMWASRNLSMTGLVNSPEEYGDYFAWGEVEPKDYYHWSTYKFATTDQYGDFGALEKYNTVSSLGPVDNLTTLEMNDDAARVILGLPWRIPTLDEAKELINNCDFVNTTLNGVDGYLVTSRINQNSIFLPTAQYWDGTYATGDQGCGRYWLSTLYTGYSSDSKYAFRLSLRPPSISNYRDWDWFERYAGLSIRPVYDNHIHPESVEIDKSSMSLFVGDSEQLTAIISPANATDKTVSWSSNSDVVIVNAEGIVTAISAGVATVTVTTNDRSLTATCIVNVEIPGPVEPNAVDLGLSVKWANFNVGATRPEEYGVYYSWGETTPKDSYSWSNYMYGGKSSLTKYNTYGSYGTVDNKTILEETDDSAWANWGSSWRMPTKSEWQDLLDNCNSLWTTQNGIYGILLTSQLNGNSIFLPAAGNRSGSSLDQAGSRGSYWSSSLTTDEPDHAWYVNFNSSNVSNSTNYRSGGRSVRPVYIGEEYEWVTLSEDVLGSTHSGNDGNKVLDEKFYFKKLRVDTSVSSSYSYICMTFLSDVNPNFAAYWSQYRKTDVEYCYGGLNSNLGLNNDDEHPSQHLYGTAVSDNVIEFDFSNLAAETYLFCYQKNVVLSGIQALVKK